MIFYFTATGNSLMAAKALATEGERLVDMAAARKNRDCAFDLAEGERIGFVFPVFFYTLPDVVLDFVRELSVRKNGYCFAVITCGGGILGTGAFLKKELAAKGIILDYVTPLLMPDNAVFYFNIKPDEDNEARLAAARVKLGQIKEDLTNEKTLPAKGISSKCLRPFYHAGSKTAKFFVTDACIGCGMCASNCPDDAIRMENGKPTWIKKSCNKCSACINRCPKAAIQHGKATQTRGRYVNPILRGGK